MCPPHSRSRQSEQTVAAAVENLPAVQLMQAEAPVDATYMPPEL
jgi:hypothetical protein